MKKRLILLALALAAVTATVAAYYRANGASDVPHLNTTAVSRGAVVDAVSATGTLEAVETVEVGTQVSGMIKALNADYNDRVRKGQVIAQLEPSLFETQVEQARATVQRLQADVEARKVQVVDADLKLRRARELSSRQLLPASDLETAESNARQAEATLKAAEAQLVQGLASLNQNRVNLGHTTIVAPIDGIVISRNVDVGQTVAASMSAPTLFVLARDLARMQVNAKVDEADIGRIAAGQTATFAVDAYTGERFTGQVRQVRLEPVVEQNVVSYVTVVDVPNPELKLKPGMTATVSIEAARADDVLRVPNAALRFRPTAEVFAALGQEPPAERDAPAAGRDASAPARDAATPGREAASAGTEAAAATPRDTAAPGDTARAQAPRAEPGVGSSGREEFGSRSGRPGFARRSDGTGFARRADGAGADGNGSAGRAGRFRRQNANQDGQSPAATPSAGTPSAGTTSAAAPTAATPAAPPVARAVVWVMRDGRLRRVPVRTSTSDGVVTAVVGGELQEGDQVVTGLSAQTNTAAPASSGSPLIPRRPGGNRGQGGNPAGRGR